MPMWAITLIGFFGSLLTILPFFEISNYRTALEKPVESAIVFGGSLLIAIVLAFLISRFKKKDELQREENIPTSILEDTDNYKFSRLPQSPIHAWVGRTEELEQLNQALHSEEIALMYICADGGVGKSALTLRWLQTMQPNYCNVEKIFAWSFYSQGSHDTQNSSTAFFQEIFQFLGFKGEIPKDDFSKGKLLGTCLRKQSIILILDGLEPLQHNPEILDGNLKDSGIQGLLKDLSFHGLQKVPSLVLISSRQPLKELEFWSKEISYQTIDLCTLNEEMGAQLLKKLGVQGTEEELKATSKEMGGHALALMLLGKLLVSEFDGDIRQRDQVPNLWKEKKLGNHAKNVLQYYFELWRRNRFQRWLKGEKPEQVFMYLIGLFDRPMGSLEKAVLIDKATIAKPLRNLNDRAWKKLEKKLEQSGLLLKHSSIGSRVEWDCHPLIR